jgi:putative heme-binding domain-containing protein
LAPATVARAGDDSPAHQSALVKLLASGRVPAERQGALIEMIGKRGTAGDLLFLYERALLPKGFALPVRVRAFDALAAAALTRKLRPSEQLDKLIPLLQTPALPSETPLVKSAIRLAGLWKLEPAGDALLKIGESPKVDDMLRALAVEALAEIGGPAGRSRVELLLAPEQPVSTRLLAVAAFARLDLAAAAPRAAELLPRGAAQGRDLAPILAAFLNRQGGSDLLTAALEKHSLPADAAGRALRAVYSLGRSDPALVANLRRAAGLSNDLKPPTPGELAILVADVLAKGDPARGEAVFRRADLNCLSCHSLSKAGGDVGPDLSSIGQSSPPDYIASSILLPDQAIKEQYQTLLVLTSDGQVFQGIVADKDKDRIVLKEATGALRVVPVESIVDQKAGGSLMPKGLAGLMTRAELVDLVRFLSELGKPGAYAIRSTPAIQHWRVLKSPPRELCTAVPGHDLFKAQVLEAAAERWSSAYATVAGSLPLGELAVSPEGAILYLQGEIDVSSRGVVQFAIDSSAGVRVWVDAEAAPDGAANLSHALGPGRHAVTLRVDPKAHSSGAVMVQVTKPRDSAAEFTVVGGR